MAKSIKAAMRAAINELYDLRGTRKENIWVMYSSKLDKDLGFIGDLEYLHAMWLEGSPDVTSFEIRPPKKIVKVGDDDHATAFDAIVQFRDGRRVAREVKPEEEESNPQSLRTIHQREAQIEAAKAIGCEREVVTDAFIREHQILIFNWIRAQGWIRAANEHPLDEFEAAAGLRVSNTEVTLGMLQREVPPDDWPLYMPALLRLIQRGELNSDLAEHALSPSTRVWHGQS